MSHTWIIDIVAPGESRTEGKEHEEVENYQDLAKNTKIVEDISKCDASCIRGIKGSSKSR